MPMVISLGSIRLSAGVYLCLHTLIHACGINQQAFWVILGRYLCYSSETCYLTRAYFVAALKVILWATNMATKNQVMTLHSGAKPKNCHFYPLLSGQITVKQKKILVADLWIL